MKFEKNKTHNSMFTLEYKKFQKIAIFTFKSDFKKTCNNEVVAFQICVCFLWIYQMKYP